MEQKHDPYSALRYREFRFFVFGKLFLTVAVLMQEIVASWMIYAKTHDPLSLGLIGLVEAVPALSLALPGGHFADRFNRRHLMLLATSLMLLASFFLAIYTHTGMNYGILPIYVVIFFIGVARGLYNPAQSSFWPQLVQRDHYVNSSVWNSSMWQIGAVTGPALGGLCYGLIGPAKSLYIVNILIVITLFFYSLIKNKPIPPSNKNESLKESLKAGLNYFFKQQVLIASITLDLFAVLFGGAVALLPAFADQVLHCGPEGLGILRSAPAIGSVLMSFLLAFNPPKKNAGNKMLICVTGFGLCMIGFAISKNYYLSFAMLLMSGVFDNVSVVIRSTILQTFTPNEMRGRIAAVNSIFVGSSNEIGAFESGVAARLLGLVNSVVFGGCMTLVVTGITYKFAPILRKLHL